MLKEREALVRSEYDKVLSAKLAGKLTQLALQKKFLLIFVVLFS